MHDNESCIGSSYQGNKKGSSGREAAANASGTSVSPHLMIFAVSLALWVMIIAACSMVLG
jgi:hypothetical protein